MKSELKAVALLSGGIDSPVAVGMMLRRGVSIMALHMDNRPFTDDREIAKVGDQVRQLKEFCAAEKKKGAIPEDVEIRAYSAPHGHAQKEFAQHCDPHYACLLCKRQMYRVAEAVAKENDAVAILTGESLGQVASQTMENLKVESAAVSIPVWRPLIGLDKVEIIMIAEEIGTFDISIRKAACCAAVPEKPATRGDIVKMRQEEEKVTDPSIEELVRIAVDGLTEITTE